MTHDPSIERLLRWRLARAEAEAPPAPRAARLLALARPWWETWPERFRSQVERLGRVPLAYGYAMAVSRRSPERSGHPVPALIARVEDVEAYARVLYLTVRDGRLRLRFEIDAAVGITDEAFDATFIEEGYERPLFSCHAALAQSGEYRLDAELPDQLAERWAPLKVTDRMPVRLILRPVTAVG
jgi:hypothetical protein